MTCAHRFGAVIGNWWAIMRRTKLLNSLIAGYGQVAVIFPIIVAAPRYFAGAMQLGGLMQTAGAFGQVQGALSWFVDAVRLAGELARHRRASDHVPPRHRRGARRRRHRLLRARRPPDGTRAAARPDAGAAGRARSCWSMPIIALQPGHSVVVTGRSGSGKSTLFRALAGIWPFGSGRVQLPAASTLFLPQRPYIPLGTLRHVISYPAAGRDLSTQPSLCAGADRCRAAGSLVRVLDRGRKLAAAAVGRRAAAAWRWPARCWPSRTGCSWTRPPPAWIRNPKTELYRILKQRLPDTTIISIAHRPSVAAHHDEKLTLRRATPETPGRLAATELAAAP